MMFEDTTYKDLDGLSDIDKEVIAYAQSTKGHSVLRKYAYGSPPTSRRYGSYGYEHSDVSPVRSRYNSREEDYINSAVQRATSIGSDALYNTLDTAHMSRNRDYDLLQHTNAAIQPPSAFSAVKARLNRITSNLPLRRFSPSVLSRQSRSDISPIRDIDISDTSHMVASPSPRPSSVHKPYRSHSTLRPDSRDVGKSYRGELDTSDLVASAPPQPGILPQRLLSLSHRAGLSTPITATSSWNDYNLPVPTKVYSPCPILDDPNLSDLTDQRSSNLMHGYLSPSLIAKYGGSPIISPTASGTQTPIYSNFETRSKYADIPSLTRSYADPHTEYEPDLRHTKHRVLGTKRHTGNYYERLLRKSSGRSSKYWPYYDVESLADCDVSDVLSDDEYGTTGSGASEYTPNLSYLNTDDLDEYVPFKPQYSKMTSPGLLEMSPYNESAIKPDISHLSSSYLLPKSSSDVSRYNEYDSGISSLVAKSVQKAKEHLKDVNWGKYENASLVLSVEGDMLHPDNGERYGFRYYPQPISVHGKPVVSEITPTDSSSGDKLFFNYISKMRDFRGGVRNRLSETFSYKPRYDSNMSKTILTHLPPLSTGHPSHIPLTSFKKRLEGGLTHQVDVYPLPMSEQALSSQLQLSTKTKSKDKHDTDGYSRGGPVTVLDRILIKAAIVASKLEDEPGRRPRRTPRSKYAADKYRATHKVGENPLYYSDPSTSGLTASRGSVQRTTNRKAVRDAEGNFTKPRNILSWQYRLESRVPPEEVLYQPSTFNRMRERLHEAQDKMDRHRQLLDRYIPDEGTSESIESKVNRKLNELEQRDSSGGGRQSVGSYTPLDYYGPSGPPVSETRRRIRRVLNGTRR